MNYSREIWKLNVVFLLKIRVFLDKLIEKSRKKSMESGLPKCEICRKALTKSQLFFSRREHKKKLCYLCQKDAERDKKLSWVQEENSKTFRWLVRNAIKGERW